MPHQDRAGRSGGSCSPSSLARALPSIDSPSGAHCAAVSKVSKVQEASFWEPENVHSRGYPGRSGAHRAQLSSEHRVAQGDAVRSQKIVQGRNVSSAGVWRPPGGE